jgi:hypothetical protein
MTALSGGKIAAALRWPFWFLAYALGIVALGAPAGAAAFALLGKLFVPEMSVGELALNGTRIGAILAGVWAPGVAIVLCFIRGKKERDRRG